MKLSNKIQKLSLNPSFKKSEFENLNYNFEMKLNKLDIELEVEFDKFNLGIFTNDPILGQISLKADVNGSGFNVDNVNTIIIGKVSSLFFNEYEYKKSNF